MSSMRTGWIQSRWFSLVLFLFIAGLAAVSPSRAVCLATGKSCGGNTASNDRLCCPGMVCGWGSVCQPGCRINGTFYQNQARNPSKPCQACVANVSTTSWTNLPSGSSCGSTSSSSCDHPDTCNGSGTCLPNFEPATTVCRVAAPGGCDIAENCTGSSPACPPDGFLSGNTCRPAAGDCDQVETCPGNSAACPPDTFLTSECRASAGDCDPAEDCPGDAPGCPADVITAAGESCPDDGSTCTTDTCDGTHAGCVHAPIDCTFCSQPASVAVFDNNTYVDTSSASPNAESDNVQAALASLGHSVSTFTGITATDINTALAGKQVLLIPEQRLSPAPELKNDLSAAAKTAIRSFVANGGGLIIHATRQNLDQFFLQEIFGIDLNGSGEFTGFWNLDTVAAQGTDFCGGPASLQAFTATQVATTASVSAAGGKSLYLYPGFTDNTIVSLLPYGAGEIVVLGWNFDDAQPNGSKDGGWLEVLDRAVNQVAAGGHGFIATPNLAIPDNAYTGGFNVPGQACSVIDTTSLPIGNTVWHVEVDIYIAHTFVGDLTIKLQSPDGSILGIVSRPGVVETADDGTDIAGFGENSNWGAGLKFSDAASASAEQMGRTPVDLTSAETICTDGGTPCLYRPAPGSVAQPPATFADFYGEAARGNWTLCVGDSAGADTGTLHFWTLTLH